MTDDERAQILDLAQRMSIRAIARKLGRDPKTIRDVLGRPPLPPPPSKLEPFKPLIQELAAKDLYAPRILREIRSRGYTGSRTILGEYLRSIRGPARVPHKTFRRFETAIGVESQCDWSPYRVPIAGRETVVHAFSMVLAFSRALFVAFYRNERLPTLLWAHVEAFTYLGGITRRILYDNQTAVTLGRLRGRPLWNPTFLAFAQHHGFEPQVGRPGYKERRGKVERPFFYIETDFLRGSAFESWDDLAAKARAWLDTVANVRKHSTTGRKVDEAWAEEKPLLIAPPTTPFATDRREVRKVEKDGAVVVDGTFYPVPARLVGRHVTVRVYPNHVEIVDAAGDVVARHAVPERPGRVAADVSAVAPSPPVSRPAMEAKFLAHYPGAAEFLDGLRRRMNLLTPIHLRRIERLAELYGEAHVAVAIARAQEYGNFSALALQRILETAHPTVVPEPPPGKADPSVMGALDEVEGASPQDYPFDSMEATDVEGT